MPTVILLDVSLSMCRPAFRSNNGRPSDSFSDILDIRQLATIGVGNLLDYFIQNAQLEHAALVVFSSLWEIRSHFTRDHESIKKGIYGLELYDKSNVVNALRGLSSLKLEELSQSGTINIILITDGQIYHNAARGNKAVRVQQATPGDGDFQDIPIENLNGLFDLPCKIQIVNLTSPRDPYLKHSLKFYKKLISSVDQSATSVPVLTAGNLRDFKQSAIWLPESSTLDIPVASVENLFSALAELHYKPHHSILSLGHLSSMVLLSPKPTETIVEPLKNDFDDLKNETAHDTSSKETFVSALNRVSLFKLNEEISICGFLPLNEIASPAVISRHIVLPVPHDKFNEISKAEQILTQDPDAYSKSIQSSAVRASSISAKTSKQTGAMKPSKHLVNGSNNEACNEADVTKQPSFSVLLHNCLKQENMTAICLLGKNDDTHEDWYGFLHLDSRKRSSLILSLLIPGNAPVLWLPKFRSMGSVCLNADMPAAIQDRLASQRAAAKSYSSNSVIWLDPESVQADVQKIVRYAKRGPDKAPQFYKELNRIRRAAISYGFFDVLTGLASILDREQRIMVADQSKPSNQEMARHLAHVITRLRADLTHDSYETNILPVV